MNIKKLILISLISPLLVFADDFVCASGKVGLVCLIDTAFNIVTSVLIPLVFGLCFLYFFWGLAKYIRTGAGSEEAAKEGKKVMVWGVVGIFVAFSIWGIISFIRVEFGVDHIMNIKMPPIPIKTQN